MEKDTLFDEAVAVSKKENLGSTSLLQRRLKNRLQ